MKLTWFLSKRLRLPRFFFVHWRHRLPTEVSVHPMPLGVMEYIILLNETIEKLNVLQDTNQRTM